MMKPRIKLYTYQRAQKEFDNMSYLKPVRYSKNVIVMQNFTSYNQSYLPITMIPPDLYSEFYNRLVLDMLNFYKHRRKVYGNLSSKNVLFSGFELQFEGWAHAVSSKHPDAEKKLMKDCVFVTKFFKKRGVPVQSTESLFKQITNQTEISKEALYWMEVMKENKSSSKSERANPGHSRGASRFK